MKLQPIYVLLAAALLALGACTNTKRETVTKNVPGPTKTVRVGDSEAQRAAEKAQAEAEKALADLRASLAPGNDNAERREAIKNFQNEVKQVRERVADQPNSPAKTAALTALGDVDEALKAVDDLLAANAALSSAVPASLTSMHTALDQALAALDTAQASLTAALAAKPSTEIKTLLAQAQATLSTAQISLLPELRGELADARSERDALDPLVRLGDPVARTDRGGRPTIANAQLKDGDGVNADFTYMARTTYTANELPSDETVAANYEYKDRLEIQNEGVLWTTGKTLISASGIGTDELMLRGTMLREGTRTDSDARPTAGVNNKKGLTIYGYGSPSGDDWYNWRFPMRSSIKLPSDPTKGPTIEMGGPGIIFYDLEQRLRAKGGYCPAGQTETHCDDATTDDVRVAFTSQAVRDPAGDSAYYWQTNIPFDPEGRNSKLFGEHTIATEITFGADGNCAVTAATAAGGGCVGTPDRAGVLDAKTAEDKDDKASFEVLNSGTSGSPVYSSYTLYDTARMRHCDVGSWCHTDPRDLGYPLSQGQYQVWLSHRAGEDSYLQYAAYGLMRFVDFTLNYSPGIARSQAFHFGYDAYGAGDNAVPSTGDPLEASFKGRTTGWVIASAANTAEPNVWRDSYRLRGEVALTARIGGGANTISGDITGLEVLNQGSWVNRIYNTRLSPITLDSGTIAPDGTYSGVANPPTAGDFNAGAFEGAFYGPKELGELETAGSWYITPNVVHDPGDYHGYLALLGSFGAKSEPETN